MSKEALFNVLNNHFSFEGLKILDLFAGTGNISYEFASGSTPITSVDDFGCVNSSSKWQPNMILILPLQK
jgi:2-polyprenyl-3-methyl-5-hydroxy-6-metoxy-1,4-benzoquinol methylase